AISYHSGYSLSTTLSYMSTPVEQSGVNSHGAQTQDSSEEEAPTFCSVEEYCLLAGGDSTEVEAEEARQQREEAERQDRERQEREEAERQAKGRQEREAAERRERERQGLLSSASGDSVTPPPPSGADGPVAKQGERLNLRNFQIVDSFSGEETPTVNVAEWMSKLEEMFNLLHIKPEQKLAYLKINLKGAAYSMVQNNVRVHDPVEAFTKARTLLLERYGEDWLSVYSKLQKRRLEAGETVGDYLADIQRLWRAALPRQIPPEVTDILTCVQMWHGLPDVPGLTAVRATWLDEIETKNPIESALSLCRSIRTESQFVAAVDHSHYRSGPGRSSFGKGSGKGRSRKGGKGSGGPGVATGPNRDIRKARRCFKCGGTGHYKAECPSSSQVGGVTACAELTVCPFDGVGGPQCPSVVTLRLDRRTSSAESSAEVPFYTALLDTGCSTSIMSSRIASLFGKKLVRVTTLQGDVELRTGTPIRVNGVTVQPLVASQRDVLTLSGIPVQAILGLDLIRALGGVTLVWSTDRWAVSFGHASVCVAQPTAPPVLSTCSEGASCSSTLTSADVVLHGDDYEVRRVRVTPDTFRWVFRWKWIDGKPPVQGIHAPPHFPGSVERLTDEQRRCFYEEIDLWRKHGFIVPVARHRLRNVLTCLPVCQMHKSTRVRPCLNYKPLNSLIVSRPNPDGPPATSQGTLRRRRRLPLAACSLVDISKAYMQVLADPDQALWQGVVLPHLGQDSSFVMSRLGFGLAIAPRILAVVLDFVLAEAGLTDKADKFVDDIVANREDIPRLRAALLRNSFPTKEPTALTSSTVLGVTCTPSGGWVRREALSDAIPRTRRDLASLVGKLVAHYPIGGWLRIVAATFTRLCTLFQQGDQYEYPLPPILLDLYHKFRTHLAAVGDPVHGPWQ
ncbi:hypothetical protein FOZ63_032230, partial [Perkinsus olseni]